MPKRNFIRRRIELTSALVLIFATAARAQQPTRKPLNFVAPNGKGRIIFPPLSDDFQWQTINLYDDGSRPVFQMKHKFSDIDVSYALFPNKTGSTAPNICRDDIVSAGMHGLSSVPGMADVKDVKKTDHAPIKGQPIAEGSYFVKSLAGADVKQQNVFVVAANADLCAEMHISKAPFKASDDPSLVAESETFAFEPDYTPSAQDYAILGSIFYEVVKSYEAAAVYYQRAHDTLPPSAPVNLKRYITDQLAMSYGISGQVKQSRAVNEEAIKTDPDYPLYYYNLACADAEQGHAADAKLHLQQAFDRKANTLPGETLPDPTKDDSFLKLKKNKDFWSFIQTLK